jgi:hypothetical protein
MNHLMAKNLTWMVKGRKEFKEWCFRFNGVIIKALFYVLLKNKCAKNRILRCIFSFKKLVHKMPVSSFNFFFKSVPEIYLVKFVRRLTIKLSGGEQRRRSVNLCLYWLSIVLVHLTLAASARKVVVTNWETAYRWFCWSGSCRSVSK